MDILKTTDLLVLQVPPNNFMLENLGSIILIFLILLGIFWYTLCILKIRQKEKEIARQVAIQNEKNDLIKSMRFKISGQNGYRMSISFSRQIHGHQSQGRVLRLIGGEIPKGCYPKISESSRDKNLERIPGMLKDIPLWIGPEIMEILSSLPSLQAKLLASNHMDKMERNLELDCYTIFIYRNYTESSDYEKITSEITEALNKFGLAEDSRMLCHDE